MVKTMKTNQYLQALIHDLSKAESPIWQRVGTDLNRSTRARRNVNVSRLARHTKPDEIVVVPGKVLGSGNIAHALTIAAFDFSSGARTQIENAKGTCITIRELFEKNPKGQKVRIIG